ncbi:MAG: sugar phosphate nucleotidyltransferase, partial [Oscillospiraceae bacterium]|nr:sugar phosphate nucleotidyltransferase [Oscillospiraceae bacterium]
MAKMIGIITANYAVSALDALSYHRSVAAIPFGSRYRLIDFPLSNMTNTGIRTVGIITPYRYRSLMDHIGSGKDWSLDKKSGGLFMMPGSLYGIGSGQVKFPLSDMEENMVYLRRDTAPYVVISGSNVLCNMTYTPMLEQHIRSVADITLAY